MRQKRISGKAKAKELAMPTRSQANALVVHKTNASGIRRFND
jgi:hypothetical protein